MEVLGAIADDAELRSLDQAQVGLLLSFLRDSCPPGEGLEAHLIFYVTYDSGTTAIRPAFLRWLQEQGQPVKYQLPPVQSAFYAAWRRLIGLHLKSEPQRIKHRHHGYVKAAYRGYR